MEESLVNIFWFRRDLRLNDNAGLYQALKSGLPVLPIFIFDRNILDDLEDGNDRRVNFIHDAVLQLQSKLKLLGSDLHTFYGYPEQIFLQLTESNKVAAVYTNHDYEPYAINRDEKVRSLLAPKQIQFFSFKDQVIFEKNEVVKDNGEPYTVFTPYSRKWKSLQNDFFVSAYPTEKYLDSLYQFNAPSIPSLQSMGFEYYPYEYPSKQPENSLLKEYANKRDYPAEPGTSRIGVHLRFGTVSIRELVRLAMQESEVFLNELVWREFYQMILWQFPHIGEGRAFKTEFDNIRWRNNEKEFDAWCQGKTGFPIVDAGMRQLNETGFMHNRVRMITASFLTKDLLVDWRWGEGYFARKLLDYEFASNNGGWQWAAGTGCDAAPYFRVFNPQLQAKKFDPEGRYIRKWVPEFDSLDYPAPIVDHKLARERCLKAYSTALNARTK